MAVAINRYRLWMLVFVMALLGGTGRVGIADSAAAAGPLDTAAPAWLEPEGLSIVDLVGRLPEEALRDVPIFYDPGYGVVQYESGERVGNTVTIRARIYPRYFSGGGWSGTMFGCLGQAGRLNQWTISAPASTLRLYANGQEITSQLGGYRYFPAGQIQPVLNSSPEQGGDGRYAVQEATFAFDGQGAALVPANKGCQLFLSGIHENLTAVFTASASPRIRVTYISQEALTFRSYIGIGYAGVLDSLRTQMSARYGDRHDKLPLNIPTNAEYLLVNFPLTPVEPISPQVYPSHFDRNLRQPAAGTYRLARDAQTLSVDHVSSMGMPIRWQSLATDPGVYLAGFNDARLLAGPEYFVPPGIAYDPCMTNGGCPSALLEAIERAPIPVRVLYFSVRRIAGDLDRVPLRQVGPGWQAGAAQVLTSVGKPVAVDGAGTAQLPPTTNIYLPVVQRAQASEPQPIDDPSLPKDDPAGCPCGWFDQEGRMLDFIPGS